MSQPARTKFEPWNDPTAKPYVRLANVSKSFGDFNAVNNVTLDIYQREFFSLLGPSGCGKTTLLRMLAGFETPTSGRIEIDGMDMSSVPPYERPVNMMFQSYALFPHMTVERNIAFGLKQEDTPKAEISRRVEEALGLVQMTSFAHRKPHQLSGGQRQRVALARALVKRPKLLLLDEPLGALDKKLREQTQFELMGIQEKVGITFIIVTHDQEEAMTMSSRIAVMDQGRIAQVATPAEIYEYPNSRYVAEFIGNVNIFEGRVTESTKEYVRIYSADVDTNIYLDRSLNANIGAAVWVGLRPEKFDISAAPPTDSSVNCIEGLVYDIAYLGDMTIYHVMTPQKRIVKAAQANRLRLVERPITWDDKVWLTWRPGVAAVLMG